MVTDEAIEIGADIIATGCPFCLQMSEDVTKAVQREDSLKVMDLAELIEASLICPSDLMMTTPFVEKPRVELDITGH